MPDETPHPFHPGPGTRPPTPSGTLPFGAPVPPRPFQPVPPGTPDAKKKRHPVLTHGAAALVALFLGVGIGAAGGGSSDGKADAAHSPRAAARPAPTVTVTAKARPAPTVTVTATPTPKPTHKAAHTTPKKSGPATSVPGDGEYRVGKDIAAGTYRTAGPQDSLGCYWERDKDSSGDFGSIIANDNLDGSGLVTVRTGEIFKTERCKSWKRVG